jgi:NAD dependent epimerase/dehydratase family enzyme
VTIGLKLLIDNKDCKGSYNFVSPCAVTNKELTSYISQTLKRPAFFNIPGPLVKLMFGEMGQALLLEGNNIKPKNFIEKGFVLEYQNIREALMDVFTSRSP